MAMFERQSTEKVYINEERIRQAKILQLENNKRIEPLPPVYRNINRGTGSVSTDEDRVRVRTSKHIQPKARKLIIKIECK